MRLKSVVKYNISEMKYSILIFYGIMAALFIILGVSIVSISSNGNVVDFGGGGAEIASAIFLFVCGLNSFKQNYLFLLTNGITRKGQFYGFLVSSLLIASIMGAIDTAYGNILRVIMDYETIFRLIYSGFASDTSTPLVLLMGFVWSAALNLFAMVLGYFITTLYYRMSKMLKIIVSVGFVALILNILPAIDQMFNDGKIIRWIGRLFFTLAGVNHNPFIAEISLVVGIALLSGLAYFLVRRAPVKE